MKRIFQDRIISVSLSAGLLLNLLIWLLLFFKIKPTDLPITLHYNVYFGVDYLGKHTEVYIIPAAGLVILLANAALGNYIYLKSKLSSRVLAIVAPIAQLLLLASAIAIVAFNL